MSRPTRKQLEDMVAQLKTCETIDCKKAVMDQINDGRLTMRSRWFVVTEYLGLRTTWVLLVLTTIALVNLILYMISQGPERAFFSEFGRSSTGIILQNLPYGWMALAASILVVALLLMRQFSFSYIWSFHVFVVLVVSSIFVAGGVTFASGLNDDLFEKYVMDDNNDSLLAKLYCFCSNRELDSDKALVGEVFFEVNKGEFVLQTPELDIVKVMHGPGTQWYGDQHELVQFASAKMIGQRYGDSFVATHVKLEEGTSLASAQTSNCEKEEDQQRKQEITELRRRALDYPMTPSISPIQLIRSIQ